MRRRVPCVRSGCDACMAALPGTAGRRVHQDLRLLCQTGRCPHTRRAMNPSDSSALEVGCKTVRAQLLLLVWSRLHVRDGAVSALSITHGPRQVKTELCARAGNARQIVGLNRKTGGEKPGRGSAFGESLQSAPILKGSRLLDEPGGRVEVHVTLNGRF